MATADIFGSDGLIDWKLGSPRTARQFATEDDFIREEQQMQRQFTIELRVDFADSEKLGALRQVLQQAARHAFATAQLISDNPRSTKVAIYSDDFFTGHEEIALLEDEIQRGLNTEGGQDGGEAVSSDLMQAVRE